MDPQGGVREAFGDSSLFSEVQAAVDIVTRASKLCASVVEGASVSKSFKEDLSPVTIVDYVVQGLVEQELKARGLVTPEIPLIAEEDTQEIESHFDSSEVDRFHRLVDTYAAAAPPGPSRESGVPTSAERFWVLDPIDGTKGVVSTNRDDQFVIGLALIEGGRPILGVNGMPNWCNWSLQSARGTNQRNGVVMAAVQGCGTHLFGVEDEDLDNVPFAGGGRVVVDSAPSFDRGTLLISKRQEWDAASLPLARGYGQDASPRAVVKSCCGSLTKYAAVAMGLASAYVEHPVGGKRELKAWDHASGVVCVTEAGGAVTDLEGNVLEFERGPRFKPKGLGVVCSNANFHQDLLDKLRRGLDFV